jgi:putative membrane protein
MAVITTEALAHGAYWGPGTWWPIFPLFWALLLGLVIFAVFRFRRDGRWHRHHSAEDVLAERYARGEISVEEYGERLGVLRNSRS